MSVSLVILCVLLCFAESVNSKITCMDENGNPVDWFVVYKLPRNENSPEKMVQNGLAYAYLDVNTQTKWKFDGTKSLNQTHNNAVFYTLNQMYKNRNAKDVLNIFYNDETPEKNVSFTHGHTKGDVCFDKQSGFWLVHSLPRFPPYLNSSYAYPWSGLHYGQTFLCMSLDYKYLDIIGKQLLYTYPFIYDHNLPTDIASENPNIADAIQSKHVKQQPWMNKETLITQGGQSFTSFAKFTHFGDDLYDGWVAPSLQSDLLVESWQNGAKSNYMPSNCTLKYKVYNIKNVSVDGVKFRETEDHSKWAVTTGKNKNWICIGDINRQISQMGRAGGTVCSNIPNLWQVFNRSVKGWEPCPKLNPLPKRISFPKINTII